MSPDADADLWPFQHEVTPIWRDLDGAGHVNNAVYFTYMESARAEAWLAMRGGNTFQDLDIILAHTSLDYRSPALFRETVVVTLWPDRVGETSFGLRYELRDKATGRLVAEGASVQVCFDYQADRKKPIPADVRKKLGAGLGKGPRNL